MRFTKFATALALPLLAVATPWGTPTQPTPTTVTVTATATPTTVSQCNTGNLQCCQSTSTSSNVVTSLEAPGGRFQELGEVDDEGKRVRLAALFPAVARQSQLAVHAVPNSYADVSDLASTRRCVLPSLPWYGPCLLRK